jgi:hypothetical protein
VVEGRRRDWPDVPTTAEPLRRAAVRAWAQICVEIRRYAAALSSPDATEAYETYLRRVVLARVHLEATATSAEACVRKSAALQCVRASDAAALHAHGFVVVDGVLERAGIDTSALVRDLSLLHKHGVIAPTNSSCNPGACGINLRCGTAQELAAFDRQRTPHLKAAIEVSTRHVPSAVQQHPPPPTMPHLHPPSPTTTHHHLPSPTITHYQSATVAVARARSCCDRCRT